MTTERLMVCRWDRLLEFERCVVCDGPFIQLPDQACPDCRERLSGTTRSTGGRGKLRRSKYTAKGNQP